MNKQEALEALLDKCRGWENATGRRRAEPGRVAEEMSDALERWLVTEEAADEQAQLAIIGAAALYLLTDEVEVVEGRTLDQWLAGSPGLVVFGKADGTLVSPQPINGTIGRVL